MKSVEIYTDGACSGNPGPGGWGAILKFGNIEKEVSGYDAETTNNRMELTAVIRALELLKEECNVTLYSDSSYVVHAFEKGWISSWVSNNWVKSNREQVKNPDLWQVLYELSQKHTITWVWVKGHADNQYNNRCDSLAVGEIKKHSSDFSTNAQVATEKAATLPVEQVEAKTVEIKQDRAADFAVPDGPAELVEKTVGVERLLSGRIFDIDRFTVEMPNGNNATRDVMRHPGGAVVVAVDNNQDVVMVKQFRRAANQVMFELPAGKLEYGEDPMECAVRELEEETGYSAESIELLTSMHTSPAISDEVLHIYLATDLKPGKSHPDENEFVMVEKQPLDVLIEQIFMGEITDSKTIVGLMMADRMING